MVVRDAVTYYYSQARQLLSAEASEEALCAWRA